ncbi:MAG: TRAM domain-containing protein [Armatimonadetes bacterium]|nr:TRAM domain-containing protein [Armatimonadota bacterium]
MEGKKLIPKFVLEELQHIADSSDILKRNRGRRGLDILNKMRKENLGIQIYEGDVDVQGVDTKLVKLSKELSAALVTNDYNLNKVAELQGIRVLNINELANAVKPVVLPGEELKVHVIKDGKEAGQGIGYLDDGTMIVVEGGRRHIGDSIDVQVTSVLQTIAGKMIFAKPGRS